MNRQPPVVEITEQYALAERIADHLLAPPDDDSFAARVLEYVHEPDRDTTPDLPPLAPWTAAEMENIR